MKIMPSLSLLSTLALAAGLALSAAAHCGEPGCPADGGGHDHAHAHGAEAAGPVAGDVDHGQLLAHYEAIRDVLVADRVEGASKHAGAIATLATKLTRDFDAATARVSEAKAEDARALLGEIGKTASAVAEAEGLEATREAYYELSKPLVRYRELMEGDRPVVVYCSMAKKSWLQPDEPIGNPYYGPSMLRCGKVVSK